MTSEERAQVLFTARLLRACSALQWLAIGLTLVSVISMRIAPTVPGLVALYYAVRVSLDAKLFEDLLAERLSVGELDAVLGKNRERTWSDRCRGARGLAIALVLATVAQVIVMLVT